MASKFGERSFVKNREIKELHEMGIVCHPRRPYLIGIITRGDDFGKLAGVTRDISNLAYDEVDTRMPDAK